MTIVFNRFEVLQALYNGVRPFKEIRLEFDGHRLKLHSSWGDYYFNAEGEPGKAVVSTYDLRKLLRSVDTQYVQLTCTKELTVKGIHA